MKLDRKKILINICAFIIPIVIIVGVTVGLEIISHGTNFKNGENYLLADMASQYNSLYNYIHDVFVGNDSIFYSFSKGLGGNMASTFGYYLASPFNILYMFVSKVDTPFMTFVILMIKFGLCGLFMNMFFNYKYGCKFTNLIFSVSYALMGFTTVYYFNNMWFDVIYMMPLVMIGINKLIRGKPIFYTITLSLAIMFNFYMAYMLCIFCVIYFLYELFCLYKFKQIKEYGKIIIRFACFSMLAGGIAAIILIPSIINISHVMRFELDKSLLNFNLTNIYKTFLGNVFSKTYIGTHNTTSVLGRNRPVIYVSLFCFALSILYFFNKKIKRKEKILSLIVILFFIASLTIPHLQLFFQAFSFPNGYISRFSYFYTFFTIYLAAKCFYNCDKIKIRYFIILIILYIFISHKVSNIYLVFLDKTDIIISVVFAIIYLILFFIYTRINKKVIVSIIMIILVLGELTFNYIDTLVTVKTLKVVNSYSTFYNESCHNLNSIDNNFYRMDGNHYYSYLDSHTCGTHGFTTALSTNDGNLYRFFHKHGGSLTYTTLIYDLNKLPIYDSLLGFKYVNSKDKLEDTYYNYKSKFVVTKYNSFKKKYEKKNVYIYENPYALSLGYIIDKNAKEYKISNKNSFENINKFVSMISGIDDKILKPLPKRYLEDGTYEFDINTNNKKIYLTIDYDVAINWSVYETIYINDEYVESLDSENVGTVVLDNKYENSTIKMRLDNSMIKGKDKAYLYYFDEEVFNKVYNKLKNNQLKDVKVKNNKVEGNITTDTKSNLFLAIPYDKGWSAYDNGKKVKIDKSVGDFINIKLDKGNHKIKLVYYSEGLGKGICITLISIVILVIYNVKKCKVKR